MRKMFAAALLGMVCLGTSGVGRLSAATFADAGATITLTGKIDPGDGEAFVRFLRGLKTPPRLLVLHSHGGKVLEAIRIGRTVRQAGIDTAVDARRAFCDSACTLIFASGIRRHYGYGDEVFEGTTGLKGLGFHIANRPGDRVTGRTASDHGTDNMRNFYREMGVPGAVSLVDRAAFNTFFRPNGRTAMSLGIATDLAMP